MHMDVFADEILSRPGANSVLSRHQSLVLFEHLCSGSDWWWWIYLQLTTS
jgi:hypothetical protein